MQIYTAITLLCVTLAAFISDTRNGIIPNRLCISGMLLALLTRLLENRWFIPEALWQTAGILILFLPAYRFHLIGGGDVKLIFFLLFLLQAGTSVLLIWLAMFFAGLAGIIHYITRRDRYIRLGPAMFLASLMTVSLGGFP